MEIRALVAHDLRIFVVAGSIAFKRLSRCQCECVELGVSAAGSEVSLQQRIGLHGQFGCT
jgi:hypothetical protein